MRLNHTAEFIDEHSYPATASQLIEEYGDRQLELADGTETVGDVLGRQGDETFESPIEARHALYSGLSSKAIGRKQYSDRDPTPPGATGPDQVSF